MDFFPPSIVQHSESIKELSGGFVEVACFAEVKQIVDHAVPKVFRRLQTEQRFIGREVFYKIGCEVR